MGFLAQWKHQTCFQGARDHSRHRPFLDPLDHTFALSNFILFVHFTMKHCKWSNPPRSLSKPWRRPRQSQVPSAPNCPLAPSAMGSKISSRRGHARCPLPDRAVEDVGGLWGISCWFPQPWGYPQMDGL